MRSRRFRERKGRVDRHFEVTVGGLFEQVIDQCSGRGLSYNRTKQTTDHCLPMDYQLNSIDRLVQSAEDAHNHSASAILHYLESIHQRRAADVLDQKINLAAAEQVTNLLPDGFTTDHYSVGEPGLAQLLQRLAGGSRADDASACFGCKLYSREADAASSARDQNGLTGLEATQL